MKTPIWRRLCLGISLIETMVVLAVLGVVLALAAPSFSDFMYRKRVEGIAAELVTDLQLLRSQALMRPITHFSTMAFTRSKLFAAIQIGSSTSSSCYTLYWDMGSPCSCSVAPNQDVCPSTPDAEIKTVRLPSVNGLTISAVDEDGVPVTGGTPAATGKFQAGTPTFEPKGFRVLIKGNRSGSLQISVDGMGRVSTCTPDGGFRTYAVCA